MVAMLELSCEDKRCCLCEYWTKRGREFGRCVYGITEDVTHFDLTHLYDSCPNFKKRESNGIEG